MSFSRDWLSGGKLSGVMPQLQLPIFHDGVNPITNDIGYDTVRKAIADGRLAKKKDRAKR